MNEERANQPLGYEYDYLVSYLKLIEKWFPVVNLSEQQKSILHIFL